MAGLDPEKVYFYTLDATNGKGTTTSSPALNLTTLGIPPTISGATINGSPVVGAVLTAVPGDVTGTPTPDQSYKWQSSTDGVIYADMVDANGDPVSGVTYTPVGVDCDALQPVACDLGKYLRVVITETNGSGSAEATSDGVGPVAQPAAAIASAQVGGTVAIGEQLYAVSEGVTGDPYPTESYQWQISTDGVAFTDIYGAIDDIYTPSISDYQKYLRVIITASNDLGVATATSPATSPVDKGSPRNPTFDTPVAKARGFTVNVTNYDPAWTWTASTSAGSLTLGTPSGSVLPITIRRLSPGASATVTVNTTQSVYYYDGTGSVTGRGYATNTVIATIDNGVGTTPQGIAIDPAGQFAYVANHSNASVSKIDVATNTLVDMLSVGTSPTSIAVDQAGQFAYVTNADSNSVSKIDLSTFTVSGTVNVSNNPTGIAIDPLAASSPSTRNFAYVTTGNGLWWSSTVKIDKINLTSMQVVDSKDVGDSLGPQHLAIDPAGAYAYVNASTSWTLGTYNDVIRVALPGLGSVSQVTVGSTPMGLAIDPAGTYAYVANSGATTVSKINLTNFTSGNVTTISGMGTTPNGMGVSPVGSFAYVTNKGAGTVNAIRLTTSAESPAIVVGSGPFDDATTPDGEFTYVTNSIDGTVSVIYSGMDVAPTISGASISGTAQVGQVLTAVPGVVTGVPIPDESYQWRSASSSGGTYSDIVGATEKTYTPVAADRGMYLKVVITETNSEGSASATSSATSAVAYGAALTPVFDTPVRTANGFTVNVTNYDPAFTWPTPSVSGGAVSVGTPSGSTQPYTVTGLSAAQSANLTVTTTRTGYTGGTATVTGTALNAARIPTFGATTPTADGFTVQISNYSNSWTWAGTATAGGSVTVSGSGLVTVTGVAPNTSSTATITTTRATYADGSAQVTATSLRAALTPTFDTTVRTVTGYTVNVTNYDSAYTWPTPTVTAGSVSVGAAVGTVRPYTVTALTAGQSSDLTVTTTRTGYAGGTATVTGQALSAALTPTFDTPVRTATGYTVNVTNYDPTFTWPTPTVTAGSVSVGLPLGAIRPYTVTALTPGQSSILTVTTTATGYVGGSATVTAAALNAALTPTFDTPVRTATGYTVNVTNYSASYTWPTPTVSAGSVAVGSPSGSTVLYTVSGLTPGQSADLTVTTTRTGYVGGTATVTGQALLAALTPTFDTPVRTATGFTVNVTNYDAAYTWAGSATSGGSVAISGTGLVTVTGVAP
ncbi:MAG: hypothetical protein WCI74_09090, partial [Actinomycetes bacterium]